jgi:predicted ATPase
MLENLNVNNFKAWEELNVQLKRVTGLFGSNSSGKSSILQFLLMLKQTKIATDRGLVLDFGGQDQLINLGGFQDMIHNRDKTKILTWTLEWSLDSKLDINNPSGDRRDILESSSRIGLHSKVYQQGSSLICDLLKYDFGKQSFSISPKKLGSKEYQLNSEGSEFKFVRNQSRVWALPGPLKTHLFPDQAKTYFKNSNFLGEFEAQYELLMNSIYYLGPLRDHPRREYPWSGARPNDVGSRGEYTVAAILAATLKEEKRNLGRGTRYKSFQEMIAYWLKELGLIHSFTIEEIGSGANLYRASVKRDAKSPSVLLTDVGFGVSQVLPALVLLYYVPEGSTVLMEQPEIHLHPSVQSGLADIILKVASTRNLQVIVESHSEHMLRRFQRRIAEAVYPIDLVNLYFCSNSNGKSELADLKLNIFGEIQNWPHNFFGDEMTEIAETRKAVLRRKAVNKST